MNKYEQLVEFIINDENDKARALFHAIVVEKSRDIYESLVEEEDLDETIGGNEVEDLVDEVSLDEEGISEEEEEDGEFGGEEELGHDEFGGEEHGEEEIEDRVLDLESALDELKAEFDALMADEAHEPEHHDGITDPDFGGEEEEFGHEDEMEGMYESKEEDEDDEEEELDESIVREYVENVGTPYQGELDGKEGKTVGTGKSFKSAPNTKDPVAGKNPIGAGAASGRNIATGKADQNPDGSRPAKATNEYTKGEGKLPDAGKFKNVPGNKKVWDGNGDGGHGAEKVGEKEGKLAGNDGRRPVNTKSTLKPRA